MQICPEVFALDAAGAVQVVEAPDVEFEAEVADAADMCPTRAITVEEVGS